MKISFDYNPTYNIDPYDPPSEPSDDWYDEHYPDTGSGTGLYKYNEETDEYEEIMVY